MALSLIGAPGWDFNNKRPICNKSMRIYAGSLRNHGWPHELGSELQMAVSVNWGAPFSGVLTVRAQFFGVCLGGGGASSCYAPAPSCIAGSVYRYCTGDSGRPSRLPVLYCKFGKTFLR